MDSQIKQMQEEVSYYAKKIENLCLTDKQLDSIYLGTQIYMSPLIRQPDLMFIGINPGSGAFKYGGSKPHSVEPLEKSSYETHEFQLQNEWITIFGEKNKINNKELLFNAVKTNYSFFATENIKHLKLLKSILKKKYKIDVSKKEKEWLKLLINYVEPKVIICEGIVAFNKIKNIYSKEEFIENLEEHWSIHRYAYLNNYYPVLGFKRIYSRFSNIEDVIDTIYDAMKETYIIQ